MVEDEQEQAPDGDRDRTEQDPLEHELRRIGPGEGDGDDEHERERRRPAEGQPRGGRPERRDCRDGGEPRSQQRRRERQRTRSRTGCVRDGEGREHEQRNPAERAGRLEPLQDRPGGEQHRHDGGRERELDRPPERHAPEELQQGGRRILSSCERSLSHPERIVPDETEPGIVALHLKRYEFARPYCVGKRVLDAGCGVGYGSAFLGEAARSVVGVDVSAEAIEYARTRYGGRNVEFAVGDLQQLERGDAEFDAIVAFEVIEHLPHPEQLRRRGPPRVEAGRCARRLDSARGRWARPAGEPLPRARVRARRVRATCSVRRSVSVDVYGQRRVQTARHRALQRLDVLGLRRRLPFLRRASRLVTGTAPMDAVSSEGVVISPDGVDDATELVAVCRP